MMEYKKFEDHIQEEFYMATESVDIDQLIGLVHKEQTPTDSNRLGWLFLSLSILLVVGSYSIYTIMTRGEESSLNKVSSYNQEVELANYEPQKKLDIDRVKAVLSPIVGDDLTKESSVDMQESAEIVGNIETESKKLSNIFSRTNVNILKGEINGNTSIDTDKLSDLINNNSNNNSLSGNAFHGNIPTENHQDIVWSEQVREVETTTSSLQNNSIWITKRVNKSLEIVPMLRRNGQEVKKEGSPFQLSLNNRFVEPVECFDFGVSSWNVDILAEMGVLAPLKRLEYIGNNEEDVFLQRKANEKSLEGLQAGLYIKASKGKSPFYVKIGASYTRIAEQIVLEYSTSKIDTSQGIISITESQNGDTITVIKGDIYTTTTTTHKTKKHHYFHLYDIPLSIGYSQRFSSFSVGLELGAQVNILAKTKGTMLLAKDHFDDVNAEPSFKANVGMSYFAGLNFGLPISYRGELVLSARFRYLPNNFGSNVNDVSQKYNLAGIHLGYQHRI